MRYILILFMLVGVANAQFAPTSSKTKFINGIGIGSKDTSAFAANDTMVVTMARDSVMYYKYKGYWRAIGGSTAAYKLITDTLFNNGYTTRVRDRWGLDSLGALKLNVSDTASMLSKLTLDRVLLNGATSGRAATVGALTGTSGSFSSLNSIATNGIALNIENNSTGFSAAQFKNSGSGNISTFSNNGGVVAIIGNSGSITAGECVFSTATAGALAGNIKSSVTSASGSTGYGLLIESEASALSSYALAVRNLSGSNTYLSIPTETAMAGNVGIGTASPSYKLDVVGSARISSLPSFTSGGSYVVSNSGILSSRTASELRSDIGAISFSDSSTIIAGRWLPNRSLDTATALQSRIQTKSPIAGSSAITTVGTLSSGSIPYSLLTGTPTIPTSSNYISNQTSAQSGANFNISGNGVIGGNVAIGQAINGSYSLAITSSLPSIFTINSNATSATYGGSVFVRQTSTTGNGNGLSFQMYNASSSNAEYAYAGAIIESNTAGAENGAFIIAPQVAGVRTERFRVGSTGAITAPNLSGTGDRVVVASSTGVLSASSNLTAAKIIGNSSTPSVALGSSTYVGSGASVSISGNDMAGVITLNTGTGCNAAGISERNLITVTFNAVYSSAPVVLANAFGFGFASKYAPANQVIVAPNATTTAFVVSLPSSEILADGYTYIIAYHVIGR